MDTITKTVTIKTVFGALQGNVNKQCELVYSNNNINLWLILSKDDRSLCLEKESILYRVGYEDQLAQFKQVIDNNTILDLIKSKVDQWSETFNNNKEVKIFTNVNFFALFGKIETWFQIRDNNERLKIEEDTRKEEEEKRKQSEAEKLEEERILSVIEDIKQDKYINCNDLVTIADRLSVPIHLRTRGWLLNTGSSINTQYQTFDDRKKSKGSPKAFEVLHNVRNILLNN